MASKALVRPTYLGKEAILVAREGLLAMRIYSRLLGCELWLARNDEVAARLKAEEGPAGRLPVIGDEPKSAG